MLVKIIKQCGIAGKSVKVGEVADVPDWDGQYLIGAGKAVKETSPPPPKPKPKKKADK